MTRYVGIVAFVAALTCPSVESVQAQSRTQPTIIQDVVYGHKLGMALTLDVYHPATPNGAGVVFMNSGGYRSPRCMFHTSQAQPGRLFTHAEVGEADAICREFSPHSLVEHGFTVFNVRHGSSPKFVVPEIVEDVRRAIRFVRNAAIGYGVDPDRLGVWGGSAGGHLALLLGSAPELGPSVETGDGLSEARVAAVVAYFPVSDMETERPAAARWTEQTLGVDLLSVFPAVGYPLELDRELSPVYYATADDPPTLIIHGDVDTLVPLAQGKLMHEALVGVGVESELIVVEGAEHGFLGKDADFALAETLRWFQSHLLR